MYNSHIPPGAGVSTFITRFTNRTGTQAEFNSLYPAGYTGVGGVDQTVYPKILQPGEIGVCLDTKRAFIGNSGGEYVELSIEGDVKSLMMRPLTMLLPETSQFLPLPQLSFNGGGITDIRYSATDNLDNDWTLPGYNYTKAGKLTINTATETQAVTLYEVASEASINYAKDLYFKAAYDISRTVVVIHYRHNITSMLRLTIHTLRWEPFLA